MIQSRVRARETAAFIRRHVKDPPVAGVSTGTGLSRSIRSMTVSHRFEYRDIPHFPVSTVEGHEGALVFGTVSGRSVMVMKGRFHLYEGYSPLEITFPVRVMQELGVRLLVLINAAGGFRKGFRAGDIMGITDHVNLTGENPLTGPNEDRWGLRFPDMTQVYDPELLDRAESAARRRGIRFQRGVYAGLSGPSLETPAEIRFLKTAGCHAVGFSTVMEAVAGVHAGMKIAGLSLITNINHPDRPSKTTIGEVLEVAKDNIENLDMLVPELISSQIN